MIHDVIEVSYTGDILAHRRCPRAWSYEKQAGFHPYEQVQAMEGRLVHHAMEWLTNRYASEGTHASKDDLQAQLGKYFRVLWARGIRTMFESKAEILRRVVENLYPSGTMHATVRTAIEGAVHTEYEIRTVRKLIPGEFAGKGRLLLTGILDLVVQQENPITYPRTWEWTDVNRLEGCVSQVKTQASTGDLEIWDYKATQSETPYMRDYVRQLLTYAALYQERALSLPKRCVLFFVNESDPTKQLVAIQVDKPLVDIALEWTVDQVRLLRHTTLQFQSSPISVEGGGLEERSKAVGQRVSQELKQQCTACGFRFDCVEYVTHLGRGATHPDVLITNVRKN